MNLKTTISILVFCFTNTVFASQLENGIQAFQQKQYNKAMEKLLPIATNGNNLAELYVARIHEDTGKYSDAFKWYKKTAKNNITYAQFKLGALYRAGVGTKQNLERAKYWYTLAANTGSADAQNDLGAMYEHGIGLSRDLAKAFKWYEMAALQNHSLAQNNFGDIKPCPP